MAKLRRVGDLAQMLLKSRLQRQNDEYQSDLIRKRQEELAEQNFENTVLGKLASDPRMAQRAKFSGASGVGGFPIETFIPSQQELDAPDREQIGKVSDQKSMPSIESLIAQRAGRGPIEDLTGLTGTLQARSAQLKDLGLAQEAEMDREVAQKGAETYETGAQTERLAAENFPALLGREMESGLQENELEVDKQKSLNPILVQRAGQSAGASARATNQVNREFAENDPALDALAEQAMQNPDMMKDWQPGQRFQVQRRIAMLGKQVPAAASASTKRMIEDAEQALDIVKSNKAGIAGLYGVPSMADPGSIARYNPFGDGTPAAGSSASDLAAAVDALSASLTLPRLELMKGFGHLSDADMSVLSNSATRLKGKLSDQAARNEIKIVEKILATSRERAGLPPREGSSSEMILDSARQKWQNRRR